MGVARLPSERGPRAIDRSSKSEVRSTRRAADVVRWHSPAARRPARGSPGQVAAAERHPGERVAADEQDDERSVDVLLNPEPAAAVDAMLAAALENGGRDNVSVIVVDVARPGHVVDDGAAGGESEVPEDASSDGHAPAASDAAPEADRDQGGSGA